MYKLSYLDAGNVTYPYIINLNVLEVLQEKYGTLAAFEREILGIELIKDEDGHVVLDNEGKPAFAVKEPSVRAVNDALIMMVHEGLRLDAIRNGRQCVDISDEEILADCSAIPYREIADKIHDEYFRRFQTKK